MVPLDVQLLCEKLQKLLQFSVFIQILIIIVPAIIPFFKIPDKVTKHIKRKGLLRLNRMLVSQRPKKQNKNFCSIGILETDFANVEDINIQSVERRSIYLLEDPNEDYETRQPLQNRNQLESIIVNIIQAHYNQLELKLKDKQWYNDPLFQVEYKGVEQPICKVFREIYTIECLETAIKAVKDSIGNDGSIKFIGDKLGICGYNIKNEGDKKILQLSVYQTDHFTFKVFKHIFKNELYNSVFCSLISKINETNEVEQKSLLVESMAFLFSSVGLDILIGGTNINDKRKLLVALRNGAIESNHVSTLHIPVNESFSKTDIEGESYSVSTCIMRGIKEELGIPSEIISKGKVSFHDFAVVADEGEIGFGCYVDISGVIPIEQARLYPAQDKFMELKNIFILPYPKFKKNHESYIDSFYSITGDDRFCMRWQSFATLIYQRAILRNLKMGFITSTIVELASVGFIYLLIAIIIAIINRFYQLGTLDFSLKDLIITTVTLIFFHLLIHRKQYFNLSKRIFKPFVPQWDGDVKVLQSYIDFLDSDKLAKLKDSRRFGLIVPKECEPEYRLSDLSLVTPPYCSVRKKNSNYSEYPISFFYMNNNNHTQSNKLKFIHIPYSDKNGKIQLFLHVSMKNGEPVKFKFTENIKFDPILKFNKSFDTNEILAYSKYYNLDKSLLEQTKYATLDIEIVQNYEFYDLLHFNQTYYCSISKRNQNIQYDKKCLISAQTTPLDFYNQYIKGKNLNLNEFIVCLEGNKNDLECFINAFVGRNDNRAKFNELDLYIMQLFLIRNDIVFAKIIK